MDSELMKEIGPFSGVMKGKRSKHGPERIYMFLYHGAKDGEHGKRLESMLIIILAQSIFLFYLTRYVRLSVLMWIVPVLSSKSRSFDNRRKECL